MHGNRYAVFADLYKRRYFRFERRISALVLARFYAVYVHFGFVVHSAEMQNESAAQVAFFNVYLARIHAVGDKIGVMYAGKLALGAKRHFYLRSRAQFSLPHTLPYEKSQVPFRHS